MRGEKIRAHAGIFRNAPITLLYVGYRFHC